MLLPLLLDFGLLEFCGTMMTRIMRPVFRLPGRSAVDCFASWLGDGSVGILLTSKQYEGKFYTQREAAVIGTTFSAVSITFCLVVISQVKLEHMFVPFYLTVCLAGVVAAIVVPRLPPLSWKKDVYSDGTPLCRKQEAIPHQHSVLSYGYQRALTKADSMTDLGAVAREGVKNALDMVFGVLPVVMAIGTCALMLAEHTPIFNWLGAPFVPLLELLQLPEAEAASKTIMVGFADMFIPAVLASTIESDITRFVIAAMSVTQLIYMSEVGGPAAGQQDPGQALGTVRHLPAAYPGDSAGHRRCGTPVVVRGVPRDKKRSDSVDRFLWALRRIAASAAPPAGPDRLPRPAARGRGSAGHSRQTPLSDEQGEQCWVYAPLLHHLLDDGQGLGDRLARFVGTIARGQGLKDVGHGHDAGGDAHPLTL